MHSRCFRGGYCNLINIDISKVVVEQQRLKYPQINWEVMDVLDMSYEDGSVPAVVDKSLIDTLLCYKNRYASSHFAYTSPLFSITY
jgi:hypothetical protein